MTGDLLSVAEGTIDWAEWLSRCTQLYACDHGSVICWPAGKPGQITSMSIGAPDIAPTTWVPVLDRSIARSVASDNRLLRDREYRVGGKSTGDDDSICVVTGANPVITGVAEIHPVRSILVLRKADGKAGWSGAERRSLSKLAGQVGQTLLIQRSYRQLEMERIMSNEILDRAPRCIMVLQMDGTVGYANYRAKELLGIGDGLGTRGGKINIDSLVQHATLYDKFNSMIQCERDGTKFENYTLAVQRPSGKAPYQVVLQHLDTRLKTLGQSTDQGFAVAYVYDPTSPVFIVREQIISYYGFTAAQANLATALYTSDSIQSAAKELGISVNTARTHLRKIYSKVGVHSQAEFQRELARTLKIE